MIQQCLAAGVVDEMHIALAPVVLGTGTRLFDEHATRTPTLRALESVSSPHVTHLRYVVER